jgi:hypothetical protein
MDDVVAVVAALAVVAVAVMVAVEVVVAEVVFAAGMAIGIESTIVFSCGMVEKLSECERNLQILSCDAVAFCSFP